MPANASSRRSQCTDPSSLSAAGSGRDRRPLDGDDHVLEPQRQVAAEDRGFDEHRGDLAGVVAATRFVGDEQNARARAPQAEGDLALAEDRHQRTADRSDAQRRERDDDELDAVGQLKRDALAGADAQLQQQHCRAVDAVAQLVAKSASRRCRRAPRRRRAPAAIAARAADQQLGQRQHPPPGPA